MTGWLVVTHTYLYYFPLSFTAPHMLQLARVVTISRVGVFSYPSVYMLRLSAYHIYRNSALIDTNITGVSREGGITGFQTPLHLARKVCEIFWTTLYTHCTYINRGKRDEFIRKRRFTLYTQL